MHNRVGLIGGMGAVASAEAYKRMNKICQDRFKKGMLDRDYIDLVIHNVPSQGLSCNGVNSEEIILDEIIKSARLLSLVGATNIGIACNSVHIYYEKIQRNVTSNILNIVELTAKDVARKGARKVGVIGSKSTNENNLYSYYLEREGVESIEIPITSVQKSVNKAINKVIGGNYSYRESKILEECSHYLLDNGADVVIIGCTELSMLTGRLQKQSIPFVDSLDVLSQELVAKSLLQGRK